MTSGNMCVADPASDARVRVWIVCLRNSGITLAGRGILLRKKEIDLNERVDASEVRSRTQVDGS